MFVLLRSPISCLGGRPPQDHGHIEWRAKPLNRIRPARLRPHDRMGGDKRARQRRARRPAECASLTISREPVAEW